MGEIRLSGRAASPGLAIGPVVSMDQAPTGRREPTGDPEREAADLRGAISAAAEAVQAVVARSEGEAADILAFQVAMLEDDALSEGAFHAIEAGIPADEAWRAALDNEESRGLRHDDGRDETPRPARENVKVETDECVSGTHAVGRANQRLKAFALQRDGVDADVEQYFRAARSADRHGMRGFRQRADFAVTRRAQDAFGRIDGDPVAQHAACEHLVVHFVERGGPA